MSLTIYQGEHFCIGGVVEFDPEDASQNLADYDMVLKISTTETGKAFICYTEKDKGDLQITRKEDNSFVVSFSDIFSASLSPGPLYITIGMIEKEVGAKSIVEVVTSITVKKARLKRDEL